MSRKRLGLRPAAGLVAFVAAVAMALFIVPSAFAVSGAADTTDNPGFVGPAAYINRACTNGPAHTTPAVNCNIYLDKRDVWINGGPTNGVSQLSDGYYFFAVLSPG